MTSRRLVPWLLLSMCVCYVPPWWSRGWRRDRVDSVAEAELLAPLAEHLMPGMAIGELFRSYPAPEGWGGHALKPDLSAYGVLREKDAALFVEYDGYWRHGKREGEERDVKKNKALLEFAPPGSYVVRISHTITRPLESNVLRITVTPWRRGHQESLAEAVKKVLKRITVGLKQALQPGARARIQDQLQQKSSRLERAQEFVQLAVAASGGSTWEEVRSFFIQEGFGDTESARIASVAAGRSISAHNQPMVRWMQDNGLNKKQQTAAIVRCPQILGYSIEQNLEPKVQWLHDLGLSKAQVAKTVAGFPQLLGLSIEQNLEPKVQWLQDLGLSKAQVAKAVAGFPQLLALSIEQNLEPKVQWLQALGVSKAEVAKAVAGFPTFFRYSLENNITPKFQLLLSFYSAKEAAAWIAKCLRVFSYSCERLRERLSVLASKNKTEQLIRALIISPEDFKRTYLAPDAFGAS